MHKKITFFFIIIILIIVIGVIYKYYFSSDSKLSDKIIDYININADDNNTCILSMKDVTNFEWDKMIIYQVGSTNAEISEVLGVDYQDSVEMTSGIIFVHENKIVYKERIFYNPEHPYKLFLNVGEQYGQPKYIVSNSNDAIFEGSRYIHNGEYYYEIDPFNKE